MSATNSQYNATNARLEQLQQSQFNGNRTNDIGAARILIRMLQCIGLWPLWPPAHDDDDVHRTLMRQLLQRYYRYLLHLPLTFTYNTLMWIAVLTTLERAGNMLYIAITELGMMALALSFWRTERLASRFMHEITNAGCYALRNDVERRYWQQQQRRFARIVGVYIGGGVGVLCTAFGATLLMDGYDLPYDYWLPFEWRNARNYWYAYGYEVLAMSLTCISNVTMDMLLCYYLLHVALLYKLIGMRLMALQHLLGEQEARDELLLIIMLHKRVKRLTTQCETLVSLPILAQIVLSAFILCLSAYRLQGMRISENPGQFLAMLQFVSVLTLQIFLPCYFANEITINSHHLTTCVYSSNWEQRSAVARKPLNLYMELLKAPAQIKAGNFFTVGLPIFTKTLNNAYSLLAVLLNTSK